MFFALPIRDEPKPPGRPWATYALIACNLLVFLVVSVPLTMRGVSLDDPSTHEYLKVMSVWTGQPQRVLLHGLSAYDVFLFDYGLRPAAPSVLSVFAYMFLHGGWMHLVGNMLFLWIAGDNVEYRLGRVRFVLAYVAMGVAAALTFMVFNLGSQAPMVGASGAVFGVLGCYFLWFPQNRVLLLVLVFWFLRIVRIPARWVLGGYVLVADLLPMAFGEMDNIAHMAHIGGFLSGLGIAALVRGRARAPVHNYEQAAPSWSAAAPRVGTSLALALHQRDVPMALRLYSELGETESARLDASDVFDLAELVSDAGRADLGLAVLQRFIATHPTSPWLARAHLHAGLLQWQVLRRPTAAAQHLLAVLDLAPSREEEATARRALVEIETGAPTTLH